MSEVVKHYEVEDFVFEFAPQGDPYRGILVARAPELQPYTAEVTLSKPRSCDEYAARASEVCGMSRQGLKAALNALCSRRYEEVSAAQEAEAGEPDQSEEYPEVTDEEIDERVSRPGVLGRFVEAAVVCSRVIGERKPLGLISLAALSAQLAPLPNGRPLGANVILTSPPGRGKNYLCDAVARLLPGEFCFPFESASAKALYYAAAQDPEFLKHRWVYPNEAEGADLLVEVLRPLLSGGSARHVTVNKDATGRNVGEEFTVEGPATVTIPTVRNKLDSQLQSRMLVADLKDYEGRVAAHSGAVSEQLSPGYAATDYSAEVRAWQQALRTLAAIRRVVVPVEDERFRFDSDEVPHGARLWANLLALMSAHAWLEQRNREVIELPSGVEAIVASPEDYEAAYEVFKDTCERSIVNLSGAHRKILDAAYELQRDQESRGEWDSWKGLTQRKIAAKAGVSQSTVSENKTFLVKSAKLLRDATEGGLALVEGAEPSWWETEDALDGFPRPEEVRAWWSGDSSPADPEGTDRADRAPEGAETAHDNGVEDDRHSADRGQYTTVRSQDYDPNRQDGGRIGSDDREAEDPTRSSGRYKNVDLAWLDEQEEPSTQDPNHQKAPGLRASPHNHERLEHEGLSFLKIPPPRRGPLTRRAVQIEVVLRRHCADHPKDLYPWHRASNALLEAGIFDELGFTPSNEEVDRVRLVMQKKVEPGRDAPPPLEEAPVMETEYALQNLLGIREGCAGEGNPGALIDAVAVSPYMFFVPTLEEMVEAMRRLGWGVASASGTPGPEDLLPYQSSAPAPSELERAIRRAQRAPRLAWPENCGSLNVVQDWVRRRGRTQMLPWSNNCRYEITPHDVGSLLQREGYLAYEPQATEVREVMDKLVEEIKRAAARHEERKRHRHDAAKAEEVRT